MSRDFFQTEAWTFAENIDNGDVNIAESSLNKYLFREKQEYISANISENEIKKVKITIIVEEI